MAILVFEHSDLSGSERLGETLRNHGHRLRVLSLHHGDAVPPDLDDVDGIVTCGGPHSIVSDEPEWLEPEMARIREAHEAQMPVIGICLGCQIVGRALGGEVTTMDAGAERGWHAVELTPVGREDVLHAGIAWSSIQPHWHADHVSTLPPGARILARSERCPNQTWAAGLRTYGFQYHPEIYPETMEGWAVDSPGELAETGLSLDELRKQTREHFPECLRLSQRLFEAIALCLMPVDRRHAGLAKDLHH